MPYPYQIVESIPSDYIFKFERYLFNEPAHLATQQWADYNTFYLVTERSVLARFTIFIKNNIAYSPLRGTFGSIEFEDKMDQECLGLFLNTVEERLKTFGVKKIIIKHYPQAYNLQSYEILKSVFSNSGYKKVYEDLNFHLKITSNPFEDNLRPSEKRRLKKCKENGFTFRQELISELSFAYNFIKSSRDRKQYPMSLTLEKLQGLRDIFPENHKIFVVKDGTHYAALTIVIQVNGRVLYNFYPADNEKYLSFSPSVMLTEGLYKYCQEQGFKILDLGIATDKGVPNEGLIKFKKNLGAVSSLKLTLEKDLES